MTDENAHGDASIRKPWPFAMAVAHHDRSVRARVVSSAWFRAGVTGMRMEDVAAGRIPAEVVRRRRRSAPARAFPTAASPDDADGLPPRRASPSATTTNPARMTGSNEGES